MADDFDGFVAGLTSPPITLVEVTPNDSADLAKACRAINVASAGTVKITSTDGSEGSVYIAAGIAFPIRAVRIWATGTTATGIVALS